MRQAPFRHDGATARYDAGHAFCRHRHIGQAHAGVDREVVDPLLRLFDQRIAIDVPGEVFGHAADLFQRLVNRHGADGHGAVADDPFAGVVDVATGGKVHDRIRAPAGGPDHLVHLVRHVAGDRAVADIGVDLDQEVAPDGHRFGFGVVDVVGDDRPPARQFVADKFRRHIFGDRRTPAIAVKLLLHTLAAQVLAFCHIFHFGRD